MVLRVLSTPIIIRMGFGDGHQSGDMVTCFNSEARNLGSSPNAAGYRVLLARCGCYLLSLSLSFFTCNMGIITTCGNDD